MLMALDTRKEERQEGTRVVRSKNDYSHKRQDVCAKFVKRLPLKTVDQAHDGRCNAHTIWTHHSILRTYEAARDHVIKRGPS